MHANVQARAWWCVGAHAATMDMHLCRTDPICLLWSYPHFSWRLPATPGIKMAAGQRKMAAGQRDICTSQLEWHWSLMLRIDATACGWLGHEARNSCLLRYLCTCAAMPAGLAEGCHQLVQIFDLGRHAPPLTLRARQVYALTAGLRPRFA